MKATGISSEMSESAEGAEEMRVDPARAKVLVESLEQVVKRVDAVRGSRKVCLDGVILYMMAVLMSWYRSV